MKRTHAIFLFLGLTTSLLSQPNPVPLINQPLVPSSAAPGSHGLTLAVNGTGFVPASVVNWNGSELSTTYVNAHQLLAEVPASDLASASTASVTVSSSLSGVGSNAVPFAITVPASSLAFATSTIPVGLNPGKVVVADFNGDGKADLAVVNQNQPDTACYTPEYGNVGTISILLGNGDGTFTNRSTLCFLQLGLGDYAGPQLVAGDFNGDGKTDLAASVIAEGLLSFAVFLGNGDGTFASSGTFGSFDGIGEMISADFNRDGNLDLASPATVLDYTAIFTFLGNGDGTFACCSGYGYLPGGSLAAGDFNNDGILDLAVIGGQVPVTILLANGDGSFHPAAAQPSLTAVDPVSVTAGDFNGDGILDLAIADAGSPVLTILKGKGDGTFTQVSGEPSLPGTSNFVTTADLNGDGKLDLVFSSTANTISIFLGNGDATFQPWLTEAMDYAPYGIAVGDFNGDGRLDLAVTNSSDNTVSILLQKPSRPGATVTVVSGQNPITINEPVTYTTVVWGSPTTTPTGSVTFEQGTTVLGTVPLEKGQASFTTAFASSGTFSIVASYSGDQNFRAKNSQVVKQAVDRYTTDAELSSDLNPSVYGQAVNLGCYVYVGWQSPPTGTVTFKNGPFSLGTAPLVDGNAVLTITNLPASTTLITAIYNGDNSNSKSTSSLLSQFVSQAKTTTVVTSSPNPSALGQRVKFEVTVTSPTAAPVGTVTFSAGTTTLGTVSLVKGKASLTASSLSAGATTITATYNETSNIAGSSGSVVQKVN